MLVLPACPSPSELNVLRQILSMDISARKIKDFSVIMVEAVDFFQANKARNLVSWTGDHAAK